MTYKLYTWPAAMMAAALLVVFAEECFVVVGISAAMGGNSAFREV